MALIVEDGTAKSNAEAYDTVANANTYYSNMGYSDTATEATMRRGTQMFDAYFRNLLKGYKTTSGQALVWPRDGVSDEDGNTLASDSIPKAVKYASFEMARAANASLEVTDDSSIKRVKAGSVEVEFSGAPFQRTILTHVVNLMKPYIAAGGNRLVRAG